MALRKEKHEGSVSIVPAVNSTMFEKANFSTERLTFSFTTQNTTSHDPFHVNVWPSHSLARMQTAQDDPLCKAVDEHGSMTT